MPDSIIDHPANVREGEELDIAVLNEYLPNTIDGFPAIQSVRQFPSGYSNLTYLLSCGDREYVLRRPPFGANIKSAHDMGREFSVLQLLKPIYGKVPAPIHYSTDESLIGSEFYVMERVKGVILRGKQPEGLELDPATMKKISEACIDNLADLHSLELEQSGLMNLGKPEGYVQRQVEGWIRRYYKAETDQIDSMDAVAEWLQANMPDDISPAFIHNDYKYDNLVLDSGDLGEIVAVLDWEMATVGDPLMDLGTTLGYWAGESDHPALKGFSLTSLPGNLSRQQLADRYEEKSGRDLSGILFYYVYASFKIGVICQQIYARYKKGITKDPRFGGLIHLVKACGGNGFNAIKFGRISDFR